MYDFSFKSLPESPDFNYQPSVTPTTNRQLHSKFI